MDSSATEMREPDQSPQCDYADSAIGRETEYCPVNLCLFRQWRAGSPDLLALLVLLTERHDTKSLSSIASDFASLHRAEWAWN